MPGGRGAKKSGRGDGGRGEASRQSRRVQGMEPEERKDLETVVRDARKANVASAVITEIRNEEHLLNQENAEYADQIDCLSVNIQACLDDDLSGTRFSFSPPRRGKSKKLGEVAVLN
ncbi:hypothetical protein PHYSODRAFT_341999 [Phytophthora sojae]|uniref:Uncharacterized protein n=1 Tax=Phytophthora sojae (strain P6497) TaxID=1094619 RepID=G5AF07_PHYSP|nr:hypothetical protein PHYSODRAFT_341996 [Phytophthora sojae]XP_009538661.1 hypothetical protein PHYSODRAFT_341999 [Phytophthora sojae]EGZ05797.1 hypothetical protein PHYSODRAFT_341996 [Phytophthora sojae]EGZ05800.1 hypothetical protein PHYSODRAFT_341999 [Phytophthora sojae]|eukprot:XP_009538658.1 hypothetical protein PHYSODRAFT_341996 [Phytophthora sojae]